MLGPQKPRIPGTIEDAISKIIGAMGREAVAEAVGRSASLVYAWGDPDSERAPAATQCIAMDAAYESAGHGPGPILLAYRQMLRERMAAPHQPQPLEQRCLAMVAEVGDVAAAIRDALCPRGPGGTTVTPTEAAVILREIAEASAVLDSLRRDVQVLAGLAEPLRVVEAGR